jgi:hypothetical protein
MTIQYAVVVCNDFLQTVLDIVDRLPPAGLGVLLIAAGVGIYESLGNTRSAPGVWR